MCDKRSAKNLERHLNLTGFHCMSEGKSIDRSYGEYHHKVNGKNMLHESLCLIDKA